MLFPETTRPGVSGPMDRPDRGEQWMSLPVTTASVTLYLIATAVTAAQTWSPSTTVRVPPSTRMPILPLRSAALFLMMVSEPGVVVPPDADAVVASGLPLTK